MGLGTKNMYGQLVAIPDTNLRKALNELGYIKNDSLDTQKAEDANKLFLNRKNIYSIMGLEYFSRLTTLEIADNHITEIAHLPPNLTSLVLASNPIDTLKNLPAYLRYLSCSSCGIETVASLPQTLFSLDLRYNKLKILPDIPDSLYYFNFLDNPLIPDSLPKDFREVACKDYFQNCLPLSRRNFKLFDTTIPQSPEIDSLTITISGLPTDTIADQIHEFHFRKKGKKYVCKEKLPGNAQVNGKGLRPKHLTFQRARLDTILAAIREKRTEVYFCLKDSTISIDLSAKMDIPLISTNYHKYDFTRITFIFYTQASNFTLKSRVLKPYWAAALFKSQKEDRDLLRLIYWLYMYQLVHLTLDQAIINNTSFTPENLKAIYQWSEIH